MAGADELLSPRTQLPPPINTRTDRPDVSSSSLQIDFGPEWGQTFHSFSAPPGTSNIDAPDYINGAFAHPKFPPLSPNSSNELSYYGHSASKRTSQLQFEDVPGTTSARNSTSLRLNRPGIGSDTPTYSRNNSGEDEEILGRDRRGQSLISKLKALASTGSIQTNRRYSVSHSHDEGGSTFIPRSAALNRCTEEGSDADAEETADEDSVRHPPRPKKKNKMRLRIQTWERVHRSHTAPTTPTIRVKGNIESPNGDHLAIPPFNRINRDGGFERRHHFSEGEGQDHLISHCPWRRSSPWIPGVRGNSASWEPEPEPEYGSTFQRSSNFRRALTGIGSGLSEGETTPKRPFLGAERASTFGAQRWRMIRQGLKMLGQKKEEHKVDYLKSAELMAELRAGAPAALMLASMVQRDERGNKRIPVLLEQLKLQVTDSKSSVEEPSDTERHLVFRIELEYGSGLNRMKWDIHRSLRDFANLHLRYKLQGSSNKYIQLRSDIDSKPKQPRFPRSTFPYFRGVRGLGESDEDEGEHARAEDTACEGTRSENDYQGKKRSRPLAAQRRKSSAILLDPIHSAQQSKLYNEKQRRRLEQYLQEMIRWLIFRADSNRLCRFLELSALGVRLAAEGSYHGKEGYLVIQFSKGLDMRRFLFPSNIFSRHTPKWFLVRHSYIVCVDSPENMQIYDVYLVDSRFEVLKKHRKLTDLKDKLTIGHSKKLDEHPQHHTLKFINSERKIKLLAKNERQLRQFEDSIDHMLGTTVWSKPNRFGSFAPVRTGIFAQWLVDGRDYMWNVSRAINMAKDVIYIHDWWLSPQLYMRRPAAISQKWRLDRLLQKKAREGVKIFVIIYRNVEAAIPIDSEFTKSSMLDLHPNIFVQRSPNQFKKNQFFYAHHEKICIVDHTVAFVGGIDLCFGRWDTPQHSVVDDKPTGFEQSDVPKDADHCQMWPGKDYSNPRVQDFFQLNEPYAEMYDRSKTPRMPWHDISMQIVGQPARDLTRHFVQRWNYVLRGRKPTRPTPFLLPPPDYKPFELEELGLTGTCEVQILRSASDWSLGLTEPEHSIMTAYCKMIEESEHFVYMENQFFISSCETMNVKIVNKIGDAIVERAIRAHQNHEIWRCVIVIPLMPGFQNTVDEPEGTSVRLIMQCQFRSICRGEGSIFGRLRSKGIHPQDYVHFYSLRAWGRIGPKKMLVTEQLYIHAKAIIVDDRVALIGSANINERSMLGVRDSECAAIIRDTDMIRSTMDGEPYLVGRFAHTLRMRLMREHLGLDVDEIMEEESRAEFEKRRASDIRKNDVDGAEKPNKEKTKNSSERHSQCSENSSRPNLESNLASKSVDDNNPSPSPSPSPTANSFVENGPGCVDSTGATTIVKQNPTIINSLEDHLEQSKKTCQKNHQSSVEEVESGSNETVPVPDLPKRTVTQPSHHLASQAVVDTEIGGSSTYLNVSTLPLTEYSNPLTADIKPVTLDKDSMRDPLNDNFFEDIWCRVADNNTKIFRRVFRCNPDSEVQAWSDYRQFAAYGVKFAKEQSGEGKTTEADALNTPRKTTSSSACPDINCLSTCHEKSSNNPDKTSTNEINHNCLKGNCENSKEVTAPENVRRYDSQRTNTRSDRSTETTNEKTSDLMPQVGNEAFPTLDNTICDPSPELEYPNQPTVRSPPNLPSNLMGPSGSGKRRRRTTRGSRRTFSAGDELLPISDCEELLCLVQGNLVNFPYDWLVKEEMNSNWLYQVDQVAPLQIYD
ncbi:Phospholipase [Podosphaera aphanis]|nr:Phospholipase [Podosphaera aphanis]